MHLHLSALGEPVAVDGLLQDPLQGAFGEDILPVLLLEVLEIVLTLAEALPHVLGELLDDDVDVLPERVVVTQGLGQLLYPLSGWDGGEGKR